MGGKGCEQSSGRHDHPAPGEGQTQFLERAPDSHLRGRFRDCERAGDFRKAALLQKPQHHRVAVRGRQTAHGFLKNRSDLVPDGNRVGCVFHIREVLRVLSAPLFRAQRLQGDEARGAIEPAGQNRLARQGAGLPRQNDKDGLSDLFSHRLIAQHAQRRGMDHAGVPFNETAKCLLRAALDELAQQFNVLWHDPHSIWPLATRK